jgi:hypothetical protein
MVSGNEVKEKILQVTWQSLEFGVVLDFDERAEFVAIAVE